MSRYRKFVDWFNSLTGPSFIIVYGCICFSILCAWIMLLDFVSETPEILPQFTSEECSKMIEPYDKGLYTKKGECYYFDGEWKRVYL